MLMETAVAKRLLEAAAGKIVVHPLSNTAFIAAVNELPYELTARCKMIAAAHRVRQCGELYHGVQELENHSAKNRTASLS